MNDPNTDRTARNPFDVPPEELNDEIRQAVQKLWDLPFKDADHNPGLPVTTARKARLSVLLSRQADITADKNLKLTEANLKSQEKVISLTKALFWFTGALIIIAIAQVVIAGLQLQEAKRSNPHVPTQQNSPAKP